MRGDVSTSAGPPADVQATSTKPSDVPTVKKMNGAVAVGSSGSADIPPPATNGVAENGPSSSSPVMIMSEDEDALLGDEEEDVKARGNASLSEAGSFGDLSFRLSSDEEDRSDAGSVDKFGADSSVAAKVEKEETSGGDDLEGRRRVDPENSSKPLEEDDKLKSVPEVDEPCLKNNQNMCELSPKAESKCVEVNIDDVRETAPNKDVNEETVKAGPEESDSLLVSDESVFKQGDGTLLKEEQQKGLDAISLDVIDVSAVKVIAPSDEPAEELVNDKDVSAADGDQMVVEDGSENSKVESDLHIELEGSVEETAIEAVDADVSGSIEENTAEMSEDSGVEKHQVSGDSGSIEESTAETSEDSVEKDQVDQITAPCNAAANSEEIHPHSHCEKSDEDMDVVKVEAKSNLDVNCADMEVDSSDTVLEPDHISDVVPKLDEESSAVLEHSDMVLEPDTKDDAALASDSMDDTILEPVKKNDDDDDAILELGSHSDVLELDNKDDGLLKPDSKDSAVLGSDDMDDTMLKRDRNDESIMETDSATLMPDSEGSAVLEPDSIDDMAMDSDDKNDLVLDSDKEDTIESISKNKHSKITLKEPVELITSAPMEEKADAEVEDAAKVESKPACSELFTEVKHNADDSEDMEVVASISNSLDPDMKQLETTLIESDSSAGNSVSIQDDKSDTGGCSKEPVDAEHKGSTREGNQENIFNNVNNVKVKEEEIDIALSEPMQTDAAVDEHKERNQEGNLENSLSDINNVEVKKEKLDVAVSEPMQTDAALDKSLCPPDHSTTTDESKIDEENSKEIKLENVGVDKSESAENSVKEEEGLEIKRENVGINKSESAENSVKEEADFMVKSDVLDTDLDEITSIMNSDASNDTVTSENVARESKPSVSDCAETHSARMKRLLLASSDGSDVSRDVSDDDGRTAVEDEVAKPSSNGLSGADAIATDTSEGHEPKLKREFDGDDVSPKRMKRSTDDEDKPTQNVCSDKENIDRANSSLKRNSDQPLLRSDEKKVRSSSSDLPNGSDAVVKLPSAKSAAKPLSNLDKAIARVATGGLNKREREICELLKLLDSKSIEHITGPQLDDLIRLKICEVLSQDSEMSRLRERVATLEAGVDKWKDAARSTTKQLRDLELVFKKLAADGKQENPTVMPIKITRSVGLQVGAGSLTPAQQQHIHQQQMQRKLMLQQQQLQKKTPGIITNRPNLNQVPGKMMPIPRQTPPTVVARPVGQPLAAQTSPAILAANKAVTAPAARLGQNVSPVTSPGKSVLNPVLLAGTYPATARVNQVVDRTTPPGIRTVPPLVRTLTPVARTTPPLVRVPPPGVRTISPAVRAAAAGARVPPNGTRPLQVRPVPSSKPPAGGCIDLTDEDDKVAVPTSVAAASVGAVTSPVAKPSGLRMVPHNQLTGNPSPQLTPVSRTVATASRPRMVTAQNVILGPNSVLTPTAGSAQISVVRPNMNGTVSPIRRITTVPNAQGTRSNYRPALQPTLKHPAPLPPSEYVVANVLWKLPPPQPELKITKCDNRQRGIILSWKMEEFGDAHEVISTYQLYAYQEPSNSGPPTTALWKKVGDVKSMPLPMACTLTQFSEGNKYHFAVRAVDVRNRSGPFSAPGSILLTRNEWLFVHRLSLRHFRVVVARRRRGRRQSHKPRTGA